MNPKTVPQVLPEIANDVLRGLTAVHKSLPPKLFYDHVGSALFERITELPEYYLTATERSIFEHSADEMIAQAGDDLTIIELGAGSANKTVLLLQAALRRQQTVHFYPIDVSAAALDEASERLRREVPGVEVFPRVLDYTHDMQQLRRIQGRKIILYIGSSIGNFEPFQSGALLKQMRSGLCAGDFLLLGTDMRKDPSVLIPAYDDSQGVTAAFNKNVLARINRELGGHFELDCFAHRIVWNSEESRIEMHLESLAEQSIDIDLLGLTVQFREGERIHTENSYKFTLPMIRSMAANGGFSVERCWSDTEKRFTVHLLRA